MNHYVYMVTHRPSGRYYVGVRTSKYAPEDDTDYMGSGRLIARLVAKHGRDEFEKDILETFDTREEAAAFEGFLIDRDVIKEPDCLNLQTGGEGWGCGLPSEEARANMRSAQRAAAEDPEWQAKQREGARARSARPEWHAKSVAGQLRRFQDPRERAKLSAAAREQFADAAKKARHIEATTAANRRNASDPGRRAKLSAANRRHWARIAPEERSAEMRRRAVVARENKRRKREATLIFLALLTAKYREAA